MQTAEIQGTQQHHAASIHRTLCRLNHGLGPDFVTDSRLRIGGTSVRRKRKAVWAVWEKSEPWPPSEMHTTRGSAETEAIKLALEHRCKRYLIVQLETKIFAARDTAIQLPHEAQS